MNVETNDRDELEPGKWVTFSPEENYAELATTDQTQITKTIWPSWNDGLPTEFRRMVWSPSFVLNGVCHREREYFVRLNLEWEAPRSVDSLKTNYKFLPSTHRSEWSGVYRIFSPEVAIGRCCGEDTTGTLYVGQAGSGKGRWSTLRSRMMSLAKGEHHVDAKWRLNEKTKKRYPWSGLKVQWSFTEDRTNYKGEQAPIAELAEAWLLTSYRDTFGEFPPWNERL